jgi:predicted SAM-dependent methyltransferase
MKTLEQLDIYPNYPRRLRDRPVSRFLSRLIPMHTLSLGRYEAKMAWVRLTTGMSRRRFTGNRGLLVNIGCGANGKPGWVNIDGARLPGVDVVWDCRRSLPFEDTSVRGIFTEHFLEHVDYTEELPSVLSECHRVLEPGGVLRMVVPDAEKYVRAYLEQGWDDMTRIRPLHEGRRDPYLGGQYQTKMELINVVFRQGGQHKFAYDFETLSYALRKFGFSDVRHQQFGQGVASELCLDSARRAPESLYVDAVK